MLDSLRKRFGNLIAGKTSVLEEEQPDPEIPDEEPAPEETDVKAVLLARRESQKREARFILTERIHNRARFY